MHRLSPDTCTLLAFCRKVLVVLYYGSHVFISVAQYMFGGVVFFFCLFVFACLKKKKKALPDCL